MDDLSYREETRPQSALYTSFAKASFGLPLAMLLVVFIGAFMMIFSRGHALFALLTVIAIIMTFFAMLVSLVLGIIAIVGLARHGGPGKTRAICGVALSGLYFILLTIGSIHNFQQARARAVAKEKSYSSLTQPAAGDGLSGARQQVSAAAQSAAGNDKVFAKAMEVHVGKVEALMADYSVAARALQEPPLFDLSGVKQREQLQAKRELVKKFMTANEKVVSFVASDEKIFRDELEALKLSQNTVDQALKGYHQNAAARQELVLKVRETDRRMGVAMLGMLDVLDANLGKWKYNAERRKVDFDSPVALDKYINYRDQMDSAGVEQKKLQAKLATLSNG